MIYAGFEIEIESSGDHRLDSIRKLMDDTTHITGWKSDYGILKYHDSRRYTNVGKWGVEHDASLANGAEFISPAEEKDDALHVLEEFLSYVEDSKCSTLNSCGLHLNISADNKTVAGMDKAYFLSNINHRLLYAFWRHRLRGTNVYCVPMQNIIDCTSNSVNLDTEIQNQMLIGKYRYVNRKITNGLKRLEIRVMGGPDYHKKIKEIKITTNMFCDLLEKSYEKSQPKTKRKIISYVNRIQRREPNCYTLWAPNHGNMLKEKNFFYSLDSIKTRLEKEESPRIINTALNRRYYTSVPCDVWQAYCLNIFHYIQGYIIFMKPDTFFMKKMAQKSNETFYYMFKYLDKIQYNIPESMFDLFLNGVLLFADGHKVVLTVPKSEKSTDVLWLCKYFEKLSQETKNRFVNNLSLSALRFIKKKEIPVMKDIINNREKQLIEKKQGNNIN